MYIYIYIYIYIELRQRVDHFATFQVVYDLGIKLIVDTIFNFLRL